MPIEEEEEDEEEEEGGGGGGGGGGWMHVFRMGASGGFVNTVLNLGVP